MSKSIEVPNCKHSVEVTSTNSSSQLVISGVRLVPPGRTSRRCLAEDLSERRLVVSVQETVPQHGLPFEPGAALLVCHNRIPRNLAGRLPVSVQETAPPCHPSQLVVSPLDLPLQRRFTSVLPNYTGEAIQETVPQGDPSQLMLCSPFLRPLQGVQLACD